MLAAIPGMALLMAGVACGGDTDDNRSTPAATGTATSPVTPLTAVTAAGAWSVTDSRGVRVSLPQRPQRIVAHITAAAALWDYGLSIVGVYDDFTLDQHSAASLRFRRDGLDAVDDLSGLQRTFTLDELLDLEPDLLVTSVVEIATDPQATHLPWIDDPSIPQQVPIVAILAASRSIDAVIADYATLADALGANLASAANTAAIARFEHASANLQAAIAGNPGVRVVALSSQAESAVIADPTAHADLRYLAQLGMDLQPIDDALAFWEWVAWADMPAYPADLILHDTRAASEEHFAHAADLPAVQAGQVGPWHVTSVYSHLDVADILEALIPLITNADPDLTPA